MSGMKSYPGIFLFLSHDPSRMTGRISIAEFIAVLLIISILGFIMKAFFQEWIISYDQWFRGQGTKYHKQEKPGI